MIRFFPEKMENRPLAFLFFYFFGLGNKYIALTMTAAAPFHGSYSREREWRASCNKALGYSTEDSSEMIAATSDGPIILNLLDEDIQVDNDNRSNSTIVPRDPWIENALLIHTGMITIISLLDRKRASYLSATDDSDASLLESTLLSFVATTANQLESLRQSISSKGEYAQHCSGIVACLLLMLRRDIAEPFGVLQKQKSRVALALYQNPLQCRVMLNAGDVRFVPELENPRLGKAFMRLYDQERFEKEDAKRPKSMLGKKSANVPAPAISKKPVQKAQRPTKGQPLPYQEQPELPTSQYQESLQHEALLLQANLTNDLDTVQQVEARMTEITTLLSQFSALVSEQQHEIEGVYESTVQSKDNVQKGQASLVDAAQRTQQSQHRMATVVFIMGLTLLFFNYFTP